MRLLNFVLLLDVLQNRVDPFGNIITSAARGEWMGNRGVIHNDLKQIVRPFKHKAWITCRLKFKGRQRSVMTPGRWTELFFLDEATAFAAGHRPCFECRREDAEKFKAAWIKGNPSYSFTVKTSIQLIDEVLHVERMRAKGQMRVRNLKELPDGAFVNLNSLPFVVFQSRLFKWYPFGYEPSSEILTPTEIILITAPSIVNAFKAGYKPQINSSCS